MTNLLSAAGYLLLILPDQPKYWENISPVRRCPISHCFQFRVLFYITYSDLQQQPAFPRKLFVEVFLARIVR